MSIRLALLTTLLLPPLAATPAKVVISIRDEYGGTQCPGFSSQDLNKPFTLNIYAAVTGEPGKTAREYLTSLQGSIVSRGLTLGTIAPGYLRANPDYDPTDPSLGPEFFGPMVPFGDGRWNGYSFGTLYNPDVANSSCNGKPQDLDGDGDLDLGGKPGAGDLDWIRPRTYVNGGFSNADGGRKLPDGGVEFQVGKITFTPVTYVAAPFTYIEWVPRADDQHQVVKEAGLWQEDGPAIANQKTGATGTIETLPYIIGEPEPSTLSLLPLASTLLLPRRARRQQSV